MLVLGPKERCLVSTVEDALELQSNNNTETFRHRSKLDRRRRDLSHAVRQRQSQSGGGVHRWLLKKTEGLHKYRPIDRPTGRPTDRQTDRPTVV